MSITPECFEKELSLLTSQLVWGSLHFRTARQIRIALGRRGEDLAHCRWPLSITEVAHFDTALAVLMRLLDRNSQSVNVYSFLRKCRSNPGLFKKKIEKNELLPAIDEDELHLKKIKPILDRLKKQRDSRFAHLDVSLLKEMGPEVRGQRLLNFDLAEAKKLYRRVEALVVRYYELYYAVDLNIRLGQRSCAWALSVLEAEGERDRKEGERFLAEHST